MACGGHVVMPGISAGPGLAQKSDEEKCQLRYSLLTSSNTLKGETSINRLKLCHIKKYPKSLDEYLNKQNIQVSSFGKELDLVSRGHYRVDNLTAIPAVLKNLENSLVFRHYQFRDGSERLLQAVQKHEQLKGIEVSCEERNDTEVVVVCKKTDENDVFITVDKISEDLFQEDISCSNNRSSRSDSFVNISSEEASFTNKDDKSQLSEEGKVVTVQPTEIKMDTGHLGASFDIPLTNELLDFVQQHEPQQFLLTEMGKIRIRCHVVQKDECLRLETDQKHGHLEMAEELFHDLIQMKQIPDSNLLNQLFELKEISEILKQNKKIAAKIKVFEKDKNCFILMTRDVISQVDHCLQTQLRVEAKFFRYAADIISAEDEKEIDEIRGNITDGKVKYSIVQKEGNYGVFIIGTVDAFHIFREKLAHFWDGINVHLKFERFMQNLLHNHPCAKDYILDQAKRLNIKLLWDDSKRSLYLPDGQEHHKQQIQNMLPRWIVRKQIPFERSWESKESTLEDVLKHLMSCQGVHQHKAFVVAESSGFILVGTDDVIENVFQLVESYIKSLRETRSGSSPEENLVDPVPQAPTRRRRRQPEDPPEDTPCFHIKLTEMQEPLLRENSFARKSLVHHFQKQEFPLQFELEKAIVTFEVRSSMDRIIIKDIWQKVFVIRNLDIEEEKILIRPVKVKLKLKQQFDDLDERVMISLDEKSLHLIGIVEPAQPVVERLELIIHDYKMYTMTLSVKDVIKVKSEKRKIEKMDKESLTKIEMKEGQITLICPSFRNKDIKHALLEILDESSDKGSKDCVMSLPSYMDLALKKSSKLKTMIEKLFRNKHWVIHISDKIVFSSYFYLDFEHQENELKSILITKTFDLTGSLFTPAEIVSKLASMSGGEFEIFYKSDNQLKLVCIRDSGPKLDDAFQRISEECESTTLDRDKVKCGHVSSPDELTTQLWTIEPQLRNNAKVVIFGGCLKLVYLAEMSYLAVETLEQLCLKLEMEDVNKGNPSSRVKLTPLHVDLLKNPDVMRYVYQKVRSQHFQLHYDLDSKDLSVIALTTGDADCGRKLVESCFKSHTLNLKNHPILENLALTDIADMIQVQHTVHGSKIEIMVQETEEMITCLCTDDVHEGVLKKVEQLLKQCSRSDHIVEAPSMQVAEFINRFALKLQFSPKYPQVTAVLRKDGQTVIFELTGEKGEIPKAREALSSLFAKVKQKEFSLDESDYDHLTSLPGKKILARVEDNSKCIISVYKSRSHMLETVENQNEMGNNQFGDETSTEDLSTGDPSTADPSSGDPSTGLHILDLNTSIAESDVVAVAFVNGDLSTEVEKFLKRQSQFDEWKKLSTQLLRKQHKNMKPKKVQPSVCFAASRKQNPRFAYVLLPGGENEADKETRMFCIGRLLQECVDLPAKSVGLIVDVADDTVKTVGKQIIHACLDNTSLNISIFSLREQKKVLRKLLKDAKSHFGRIKKMIKGDKSKKEMKGDDMCETEKQICLKVDEMSRIKADVLVNSVNKKLQISTSTGVGRTLNDYTGGKLQDALDKGYPNGIHEGKLAITDSYGLHCKKIFHGNLKPFSNKTKDAESNSKNKSKDYQQSRWELLKTFIHRCLHEVRSHMYKSVAFPVLGCGNLGYPPEDVVHVMFDSVQQFFEENEQSSVCEVIFVLYPKDMAIIKIFHEEWMARNYEINLKAKPEANMSCGEVVLQVFCKDIWSSRGSSDGLLCFWNEDHCKDPSTHPIVGEDLEDIKWHLYAHDFEQFVPTRVENLPAKFLYHIRTEGQKFEDVLMTALRHASIAECFTVQVPIVDEVNNVSWLDFSKTLWNVLQRKEVTEGNLTVVTILAKEREIYKTLLDNFQQLNNGILHSSNTDNSTLSMGKETCKWSASTNQSSKEPLLVVAARSETSCKGAFDKLMSELKKEGSSVDNPSGSADPKPQDYSESNSAVRLSHVFCEHPMWSQTKAEIFKRGIEATEKPDHLILKGPFEEITEGVLIIRDMCEIDPKEGLGKSPVYDLSPEKAFVVSEDHFMAVEHLVGKQEIAKCFVVKDKPPSEKQIFFRNFHHNEEKRAEAENIEQRIKGVIQEEVQFPETERQKAAEKVNAMSKSSDMFLLHKSDRNVIVIYTEDWQKMYDAKKKVQSKATSREGRRFASQPKTDIDEDKPPTSTSSTSPIVTEDTDCLKGKIITVRVYKADITKLDLDVIVNAANGRLGHGGGVARAIEKAAGSSLTREGDAIVNQFGQIPVTDLAVTTAGSLPCKKVFHAVGPQWPEGSAKKQDQCQLDLCLTILRCLCQAENLEMRSIAIPSISAALFRVPQNLCARAYVRALKIFDEISEGVYLKEVHFVDITDAMVREIQSACRAVWNTPVDMSKCDTEREFLEMCLEKPGKTSPKANESKEPTDIYSQVDFFTGNPFTKSADAIVSWESRIAGSYLSKISGFLKSGGIELEEGRKKALGKWSKFGDVETGPGGQLPVKYVLYALVPSAVRSNELLDYLRTVLRKTTSSDLLVIPVLKDLAQGSGNDWKVMFVEGLVQALQEYSKSNPNKRKILIFAESDTDLQDVQKRYKEHVNSLSLQQVKDDCVICLEPITKPSKLKCGHVFCEGCIRDAFKVKPVCPICKKTCGDITGNMPNGTMDVYNDWLSLPGYEKYKRITIQYYFPGGTQSAGHPNPGKPFRGARRTAYLPASPEGHEVLQLLRVAWDRKLTFTIGQSVTIGDGIDRVTWNEIHHKTNLTGGETNYGYPDPGYLKRVKEELAAQGVTVDDLGATASTKV